MARRISAPLPKKSSYTFEELYKEYWRPLANQFFFMERDYHLAEDLAQETLLRVWQYWDRIQWDKLGGVIGTIANNVRYGYVRKEFDRVDTQVYDDILEFECHDEGITDPLREILDLETAKFVQFALDKLQDSERDLFVDIYLMNMNTKEVAKKHKISAGYVYLKLHRIRNDLMADLEGNNINPFTDE